MGTFDVVLTDFERTLVRLFEDPADEREFFEEVWAECKARGIPAWTRPAAGKSPYTLWKRAHRWMTMTGTDRLRVERMYHAVARIAVKHEMTAAESVHLFDDVLPVLERFQQAEIQVVIVSNNSTEAVERVLKESNAEGLVDHVVGHHFKFDLYRNLKPKPNLLLEALKRSGHAAGRALLVGDSVDDMKAGRKANIGYRVGVLEHSTASSRRLHRAGAHRVVGRFGNLLRLVPGADVAGSR